MAILELLARVHQFIWVCSDALLYLDVGLDAPDVVCELVVKLENILFADQDIAQAMYVFELAAAGQVGFLRVRGVRRNALLGDLKITAIFF